MSTRRTVRVAEVLRKELAACMSRTNDLDGLLITIASIDLPPDMKQAFVYVSSMNPKLEMKDAMKILNRNKKEWQSEVGRRMGTKFTPQLTFRFDSSIERGDRVIDILTKLDLMHEPPTEEEREP